MSGPIKALTLWQPWASYIAAGYKTVETRAWSTNYRGPLAIHSARRRPTFAPAFLLARRPGHPDEPMLLGADPETRGPLPLPLGCIVATCQLFDVVPVEELRWAPDTMDGPPDNHGWPSEGPAWRHINGLDRSSSAQEVYLAERERTYGNYALDEGRFAWLLTDVASVAVRCPRCMGGGRIADERDGARRSFGYPQDWRPCPVCNGDRRCEPVQARGRQQLWDWAA